MQKQLTSRKYKSVNNQKKRSEKRVKIRDMQHKQTRMPKEKKKQTTKKKGVHAFSYESKRGYVPLLSGDFVHVKVLSRRTCSSNESHTSGMSAERNAAAKSFLLKK